MNRLQKNRKIGMYVHVCTGVVVDAECELDAISQADANVWIHVQRFETRLAHHRCR
jgi:hypothetical protein